MEAKSIDKKTLQLTENGQELGVLIYENLFSLHAEIRLTNSDCYKINPIGVFGTSIIVTQNETEIANLKMNWRGDIVFIFQDGQEFVLKAKGTFYNKYVIENKDQEKLIQFDPKFNWSKFEYNYSITYDKQPESTLFVLLGVYASNYFIASISGAIGAV